QAGPLVGRRGRRVGGGVDAVGGEQLGDLRRALDGEAVDDAGAREGGDLLDQPGQAVGERREPGDAEVERFAVEAAPQHHDVVADLVGHVGADPGVGGGGGGDDRR